MSLTGFTKSEVVLLPVPVSDRQSRKVRPAVVVGQGSHPGEVFVMPVTSQVAKADLVLQDWRAAGLEVPSGVRSQIATVEVTTVVRAVGILSARDQTALDGKLREWLQL